MIERTEVIESEVFPVDLREDGRIPPAPPEVMETYGRFKREWQQIYPLSQGVAAVVWLRPVKTDDGSFSYMVTKELIFNLQTS